MPHLGTVAPAQRAPWRPTLAWVVTALLVVVLGATPDAASASTLQRAGALQRDGIPALVSHRGASALAPENTLAAIDAALRHGADFVEFDVQLTRDGVPVLMHDPTVDRTTNGLGRVSQLTAAQLAELDAGSWFSPEFAGERVPTVFEAIDAFGPAPAHALIEFKREWTEAELRPVIDALREAHLLHRVVLLSFDLGTLEALARMAPEFSRMLLTRTLDATVVPRALALGVSAVGAKSALFAAFPAAIEEIRARGLGAAVYTLNAPEEWEVAVAQQLDLIITDDPAAFTAWAAARA